MHYVFHRLNHTVGDALGDPKCKKLCSEVEGVLRICYNFLAQSSVQKNAYKRVIQHFTAETLPVAWCETRYKLQDLDQGAHGLRKYSWKHDTDVNVFAK
ncbi:hypothetical protein Pmar_PMAR011540 [Perkinsus marinus ATCC 50983]|uniref:Uncharacterized protein n=1 Tax=Perkinsus marinus (strain ATCC 50983 / TXsc) TaxID=423536 RepID=C5LC32_PERM5|nr:hypothetical protein Pmar_PMAR011540 [Perkinsus marinus ATCC 50983]EER05515.1 hypothetical protein Pmar_PMAR011540 [Perkinsus marinus ATCC 50983]|eukprot:XP_002773699.1 hypothetical protein Pmar_PMAR011540 [Perkinsus marinus ATCC 50983]